MHVFLIYYKNSADNWKLLNQEEKENGNFDQIEYIAV